MASVIRVDESGKGVEAGVVGSEGFCPVQIALSASNPDGDQIVVQGGGVFSQTRAEHFRQRFDIDIALRQPALAFIGLFLSGVTQNLLCNQTHVIEKRLAKWLMLMRDRTGDDHLVMTHEFLSLMLGTRRSGVSLAMGILRKDGLIFYGRRKLDILDREGLIGRACECYLITSEEVVRYKANFS